MVKIESEVMLGMDTEVSMYHMTRSAIGLVVTVIDGNRQHEITFLFERPHKFEDFKQQMLDVLQDNKT